MIGVKIKRTRSPLIIEPSVNSEMAQSIDDSPTSATNTKRKIEKSIDNNPVPMTKLPTPAPFSALLRTLLFLSTLSTCWLSSFMSFTIYLLPRRLT